MQVSPLYQNNFGPRKKLMVDGEHCAELERTPNAPLRVFGGDDGLPENAIRK